MIAHQRTFMSALTLLGVLNTSCDRDFGTPIGPAGGTVVSEDGRFKVEVPAGALDESIGVSVHAVDEGPSGALRAYAIEPMGTVLSPPATVQFDWSSLEGFNGREFEGASMRGPMLVVARGAQWQQMADQVADADAQHVAASANDFSVVAVVK